ncbi:MAG: AcrR family transcriptional regulator [Myxococcota bacterium]
MTALAGLVDGLGTGQALPDRPDPALDVYLDAAEEAVARFGWAKLSPNDIARITGVERTTVYRHLGPKRDILALVIAREVHRLIGHATRAAATMPPGPHAVVEIVASAVEYAAASPALTSLISQDDPALLVSFFTTGVGAVIDRFVDALAPVVQLGTTAGVIAERNPRVVVDWAVRIGLSLFAHPPASPIRPFLAEVLVPLLTPSTLHTPPIAPSSNPDQELS